MAALVVIGIVDHACSRPSRRNPPPQARITPRTRATTRSARVARRDRRVLRIPHPRHGDRRAAVRRALQVLRRLRRHDDGAVRHRSRVHPQRLCRDRQGRRARRDADRRLCRRRGGARLSADDVPVDRRHPAGRVEPGVRLAGVGRHQLLGADRRDHRGEFHRRDRHRDLRRLSLGAVPEPAAHRDAIRAAHRARRRSAAHISRRAPAMSRKRPAGRCSSSSARWSRCRASSCWPGCRRAGISRHLGKPTAWLRTTRSACAAGSPPRACLRRDNRARRRPARHARAASPSRSRRAAGR